MFRDVEYYIPVARGRLRFCGLQHFVGISVLCNRIGGSRRGIDWILVLEGRISRGFIVYEKDAIAEAIERDFVLEDLAVCLENLLGLGIDAVKN